MYTLNNQNLLELSKEVSVPKYDRSSVKTGIVHVGIGGFHRAHQALYTDELLHKDNNSQWGICGVALLDFDQKIYNVLQSQDGLYTLVVKELDGTLTKRVIGSMVEVLYAPENPQRVIDKMANPDVKIITLTITEGGYNYNESTGEFNFENPQIQHDLANPMLPKTIFGYLTQALKLRKKNGLGGVAIQSCDNIQGNGHIAKKMVLSYLKVAEPELFAWAEQNVTFPNSMVDRITPVTTPADIENLKETSGIIDEWPVVCESFKQWVIEDDFVAGRPSWENVGAQFVKNVEPYEKMKLSLLNAGHSVVGILGSLMGYETIDQAVEDEAINRFLKSYMDEEVSPVLKGLEGVDLEAYKQSLLQRFGNKHIRDQVDRICSQSSAKLPVFVLPTIKSQLQTNGTFGYAAFLIAAFAKYSLGVNEKGNPLNIIDVKADELRRYAKASESKPEAFLEIASIFGDLRTNSAFVEVYKKAYENITKHGVEQSISSINTTTC